MLWTLAKHCTRKKLFFATRSIIIFFKFLHKKSLHKMFHWNSSKSYTSEFLWVMELDTAYHCCRENRVPVHIFQWKEKWVIFLLLTNWILSRWHGEKACWTPINNSRRLSNRITLGSSVEAEPTILQAKCSLSSHSQHHKQCSIKILVGWRKWLIHIQNVSRFCEQCLQDCQQTVLCQSHYPRHSK